MFKIDGKIYTINISRMLSWLTELEKAEHKTRELLDVYDYENKKAGQQVSKTLRELTEQGASNTDSINFNIVYAFLLKILECQTINDNEIPLGVRIAINSMINEKLIEEKNE